ncbi:MAG: hypothetical protein RR234_02520 [Christensenella sp.]
MKLSQADILEARFLKQSMKLNHCSQLCHIAELLESQITEEQGEKYVFDFSDKTDALVIELSNSLSTPIAFYDILAKYSDEVLLVLYKRIQLVSDYLHQVDVGGVFEIPEEDCDFFKFMLTDFLGHLT